jgi:Domain of unknown function (DUF4136)
MKKILALVALSCALTACESGPKIRANTDANANFQNYKTYTFPEKLGTDRGGVSTPLSSYFKEAVRREMDARGYKFVESGDADLFVNFHANARENVDVRSTPSTYHGGYYGYRAGVYGGWYGGAPEVETVRYKVGTCNIDVVDAHRRQLVWEGIAEGKLSDKVMKDPRGAVNLVVTEIFKQYPGNVGGVPATGTSS